MQNQTTRLAYLSGPVDAVHVYEVWAADQQQSYLGTSYLSQFYEICSECDAKGYVITTLPGEYSRREVGQFVIENRPPPANLSGIRFHLANGLWILRLLPGLLRFKPHVLIVTALQNYWFFLSPLKCANIVIIPAIHGALWPKFQPLRSSWKLLLQLNSWFYARCAEAVIAASGDIAKQLRELVGETPFPVKVFLPTYARGQFKGLHRADYDARPFRVLFAGRIETSKGVYDLVMIAQRLERQEAGRFHFDICGEGSQLGSLRRQIADLGLTNTISCHGYCQRRALLAIMQQAHVVIVPTTSELEEGFNMVCAEAILAGRPVVTSAVCPALAYVREAAVEVPPDNVPAYSQAILDLSNDRAFYEQKLAACKPLQEQFYNVSNSWGAVLRDVISKHLPVERF